MRTEESEITLRKVVWGSVEYEEMWRWREAILRVPLGRRLTEADRKAEAEQDHFGLWRGGGAWLGGVIGAEESGVGKWMRLRQMWVVPAWRGRGLGRKLLEEVEAWYDGRGVLRLILHARLVAAGFYEKAGYERFGEIFEEVGLAHIRMEKGLGGGRLRSG